MSPSWIMIVIQSNFSIGNYSENHSTLNFNKKLNNSQNPKIKFSIRHTIVKTGVIRPMHNFQNKLGKLPLIILISSLKRLVP